MSTHSDFFTEQPRSVLQSGRFFTRQAAWNGIVVKHRRARRGESPEHWHTEHQIVIPLAGSFTAETLSPTRRNRVDCSRVGSIYLIPSGMPSWSRCDGELEYLSIYLDPSLITRAASESLIDDQVELVETCGETDPVIRHIGLALMAEADSQKPASRLYAESLANVLAVHLLRHYNAGAGKAQESFGGLAGYRLKRAIEFIADNLEQDLGLAEIARAVEMSPYHFARGFKQATGFAPHQYLIKSRIERAKVLLAQSELPIVEVCHRVGFKSQSHFTTLFRRIAAVTPKLYRDTVRR